MTVNKINLNSDIAEKNFKFFKTVDKQLISKINSANISCLYHGGQKDVVESAIKEIIKKKKEVSIGAHISFLDKENFGRSQIKWNEGSIKYILQEQINFLSNICKKYNEIITHFKLHGALSNMASKDIDLAEVIVSYLKFHQPNIIVLAPVLSELAKASQKAGLRTALEVYADRTYEDDGTLTPRSIKGSVITSVKGAVDHVRNMLEKKSIKSRTGLEIYTKFDSVCIHSDTPNSVNICNEICLMLSSMGIQQKKLTDFFN